MKKLLALSLLVSFAQAHCNTEKPAQPQPNIVQLTKEEQILRDKIAHVYWLYDETYRALGLGHILQSGCNIWGFALADSYNADEYPDCKQTLEFLKATAQSIDAQNELNKNFLRQLYKNKMVRQQEAAQHN